MLSDHVSNQLHDQKYKAELANSGRVSTDLPRNAQ